MATTKYNTVVQQGAKYELNVLAKNADGSIKDLTGYSGRMQIRPTKASSTVLLEASTANGRLTINAPGGMVMVAVGADVTAPLSWDVAYYDLEVFTVSPAEVIRLVEGYASMSKEVTR